MVRLYFTFIRAQVGLASTCILHIFSSPRFKVSGFLFIQISPSTHHWCSTALRGAQRKIFAFHFSNSLKISSQQAYFKFYRSHDLGAWDLYDTVFEIPKRNMSDEVYRLFSIFHVLIYVVNIRPTGAFISYWTPSFS